MGAPGKAIGSARAVGMVSAFPLLASSSCPAVGYRQGNRQGGSQLGTPEAGYRLGTDLGVQHLQPAGSSEIRNGGLIGVPGEDGAKPNSGVVQLAGQLSTIGAIDGPIAHLRFGEVIAAPAFDDSV